MTTKSLADILEEMLQPDRVRLPVFPAVVRQAQKSLPNIRTEASLLNRLVSRDPGLTSNLFRAANSSFYQGLQKTNHLDEAITRLGCEKTVQIIERTCRDGEGCPRGELLPRYLPALWQHALGCALGAQWLAQRCGYHGLAEEAYLAGLLHDIGKLLILTALDEVSTCSDFGLTLSDQLIEEVIDTMHVEQGKRLISDWNLPENFAKVVDDHHDEELNTQDIVVSLVKLANNGCRKTGLGLNEDPELVLPTTAEAQFLGIDEIALAEYEIMLEDQFLNQVGQTEKPTSHGT